MSESIMGRLLGRTEQSEQERLVNELARVFYEPEEARLVAAKAGIPTGQLPAFYRPSVFWMKVVEHARNGGLDGGTEAIRTSAREKLPNNPVFAARGHAPLLPAVASAPPRPRRILVGALQVTALLTLIALLLTVMSVCLRLVYTALTSPGPFELVSTPLGGDDESGSPRPEDAPAVATPSPSGTTWSCVSFRSAKARSPDGRMTTCRTAEQNCQSIREFQSEHGTRPSACVEVVGEHPADALDTSRARWSTSDSQKKGIDGWLYSYGDLLRR